MKKSTIGLISLFLLSSFLLSPTYASADIFYHVPSFGLGPNTWTSIHFYYSDGDIVIVQWSVPIASTDTLDVMVLDHENFISFSNGLSFDTLYLNNNSVNGTILYQDISVGLYFVVFSNDQPFGMNFGYQFTLVEAEPSCECSCNCNCTYTPTPAPSPSPATISGFVTISFVLITITAIVVITRKTKVKKF